MANSRQSGRNNGNQQSARGTTGTAQRGFASMDPQRQREIAAQGGRAAHAAGTAHQFTSEEARRAGSLSHSRNNGNQQSSADSGSRSGKPEQPAEAGRQGQKNDR